MWIQDSYRVCNLVILSDCRIVPTHACVKSTQKLYHFVGLAMTAVYFQVSKIDYH